VYKNISLFQINLVYIGYLFFGWEKKKFFRFVPLATSLKETESDYLDHGRRKREAGGGHAPSGFSYMIQI